MEESIGYEEAIILGKHARLIINALQDGELSVSETRRLTGLPDKPEFSRARAVLQGAGMIDSRREDGTHFLRLKE